MNKGEFVTESHVQIPREKLREHGAIYLGYDLSWNGYGSATITDVSFIQSDGTLYQETDEQISITSFIQAQEGNTIGSVPEGDVKEDGYIESLTPIDESSQREDRFKLVFRIEFIDEDYDGDFYTLIIDYKYLGVNKQQHIDFDGFFKD